MTDDTISAFLAKRRKFIAGVLAIVSILATGMLVPDEAGLVVQAIIGFLGVYGIHEVANDPLDRGAHAA